jgi:hypothetical protein
MNHREVIVCLGISFDITAIASVIILSTALTSNLTQIAFIKTRKLSVPAFMIALIKLPFILKTVKPLLLTRHRYNKIGFDSHYNVLENHYSLKVQSLNINLDRCFC